MKKYFVITDVHGFYDQMIEALNNAGFDKDNPEHILVSCGDLFDRGKKPRECLEYLMSIPKDRRVFVCGNHEDNLMDLISGSKMLDSADVSNGTVGTVLMLNGESLQERKPVEHLLDCCEIVGNNLTIDISSVGVDASFLQGTCLRTQMNLWQNI